MLNIFKSALYKMFRDKTFHVVCIIGIVLVAFMTFLGYIIDSSGSGIHYLTGHNMLLTSLSPVQNFGLAVPINLISLTIGEYTFGTFRNKIIAGYRKSYVYFTMLLIGSIFTIGLIAIYAGLCTLMGTIFGGFNLSVAAPTYGHVDGQFIGQFMLYAFLTYLAIASFSIFVSTNIRNHGGSVSIVVVSVMILYVTSILMRASTIGHFDDFNFFQWVNPLYFFGATTLNSISDGINFTLSISSAVSAILWIVVFNVLGTICFIKRDIK